MGDGCATVACMPVAPTQRSSDDGADSVDTVDGNVDGNTEIAGCDYDVDADGGAGTWGDLPEIVPLEHLDNRAVDSGPLPHSRSLLRLSLHPPLSTHSPLRSPLRSLSRSPSSEVCPPLIPCHFRSNGACCDRETHSVCCPGDAHPRVQSAPLDRRRAIGSGLAMWGSHLGDAATHCGSCTRYKFLVPRSNCVSRVPRPNCVSRGRKERQNRQDVQAKSSSGQTGSLARPAALSAP